MNNSLVSFSILVAIAISTQIACAQVAKDETKNSVAKKPASTCGVCDEALGKAQAISTRIAKEALVPDFKNKNTIKQQRQVKYDISQILQDFLKSQDPQQKERIETTLTIWKIGALFDEHYVIAEDNYLALKPALKQFYARLAQLKAQAQRAEKEAYQAIFDQMKAAESEYEEGNG